MWWVVVVVEVEVENERSLLLLLLRYRTGKETPYLECQRHLGGGAQSNLSFHPHKDDTRSNTCTDPCGKSMVGRGRERKGKERRWEEQSKLAFHHHSPSHKDQAHPRVRGNRLYTNQA